MWPERINKRPIQRLATRFRFRGENVGVDMKYE